MLLPGVALPGEVLDVRRPAEYLLRVTIAEEREGLVGRAAHVARGGEPGELAMRGGEPAVQYPHPARSRLGGGFRPAEHVQLAPVLLRQRGRAVLQLRDGRR